MDEKEEVGVIGIMKSRPVDKEKRGWENMAVGQKKKTNQK